MQFDPSNAFEVRFELGDKQEGLDKAGYLTATVMGVLDVILLTPANPLKNIRITIVAVEESEIYSSQRI